MLKFTLDTNCIIDIAEERPSAVHVRRLLEAARSGTVSLALLASSASERQQAGGFLENACAFDERRAALGFGDLDLLPALARLDVSFLDMALLCCPDGQAREQAIYKCLFPQSEYEWRDYAAARNLDPSDGSSSAYYRWRNQILDAQAYWAHDHAARQIFVTRDRRFRRLEGHADFPAAVVRTPECAVTLL